jgi:membrane protein YqaA with SNARE-associated domain
MLCCLRVITENRLVCRLRQAQMMSPGRRRGILRVPGRNTMENWNQWSVALPYFWCFLLSIVSALVPWVNGEIILLSLTALARSPWARTGLVLSACTGQMAGKCILYWAGKGVIPLKSGRVKETLSVWKGRLERSPSRMLSLVFVSSAVGIPPFYVVTILAGALRVRFGPFFAVGACGRLVRFGTLAFVPWIMFQWFR